MRTTIKYKKELDNYNGQDIVYTTAEYYAATLPFEFVGTKQTLTEENKSVDIPKFINNLILLNPNSDIQTIINITNKKLTKLYLQPLNYMLLVNMCEKLYDNKQNLTPQDVKIKERWINPTIENKKKLYEQTMKNETLTKINNYFNDLINYSTTKITKESIAAEIGISERSLYTYITEEQKQAIKDHNKKIKQSKEVKLNLDDCNFLFVNDIPTIKEEAVERKACPIKQQPTQKTVILRDNLTELFEDYILTNNNGNYEFSDDTFSNIIKHFTGDEIEWLKSNINDCIELKKKSKLFDRTKRELLYVRYTDEELTTNSNVEYTAADWHKIPQINTNAKIEEIEYEDDADEDDDDIEVQIYEYC
jgi:hypothetical protein